MGFCAGGCGGNRRANNVVNNTNTMNEKQLKAARLSNQAKIKKRARLLKIKNAGGK